MKLAIIGAGQLGYQVFNASEAQRLVIDIGEICPAQFASAELGYSNRLEDAASCDIVAVTVPPGACQHIYEIVCPLMRSGSTILNFPTKWKIPQELRAAYPQVNLLESKLLGSAVGIGKGLSALIVLSEAEDSVVSQVKACLPRLNFEVGDWEKVPTINTIATKTALTAAVNLEKDLQKLGCSGDMVNAVVAGLMPGTLISYGADTLGEFGREIVAALKNS